MACPRQPLDVADADHPRVVVYLPLHVLEAHGAASAPHRPDLDAFPLQRGPGIDVGPVLQVVDDDVVAPAEAEAGGDHREAPGGVGLARHLVGAGAYQLSEAGVGLLHPRVSIAAEAVPRGEELRDGGLHRNRWGAVVGDVHVDDLLGHGEVLPELVHGNRVAVHGYEAEGVGEALNGINQTVSMKLKERNWDG